MPSLLNLRKKLKAAKVDFTEKNLLSKLLLIFKTNNCDFIIISLNKGVATMQ